MATIEQRATLPDWLRDLPKIEPGMGAEVGSHVALGAGDRLPWKPKWKGEIARRNELMRHVIEGHQVSRRHGRWWITLRVYHRTACVNAEFRGEPELTASRVGTVDELVAWLAQQGVEVVRRDAGC